MDGIDKIFTGAAWEGDEEDGLMVLTVKGNKVYGCCDGYDFERPTKEEALTQLQNWGFSYVGVE